MTVIKYFNLLMIAQPLCKMILCTMLIPGNNVIRLLVFLNNIKKTNLLLINTKTLSVILCSENVTNVYKNQADQKVEKLGLQMVCFLLHETNSNSQ